MLNLNKPFRHLFRKNVTVKFLADCGDPRWPLVFGITDDIGTQVIQTDRDGCMTTAATPVIENAPETKVVFVSIYRDRDGTLSLGELYHSKAGDHPLIAGQVQLTFEDSNLREARIC